MTYIALDTINLGRDEPVQAGEQIPDVYHDDTGAEQKVDFKRLVDLGVASEGQAGKGYQGLKVDVLREEAASRGLDVEPNAKKAELVAALEADDDQS